MFIDRPLDSFLTVQVKCAGSRSDKALGVHEHDLRPRRLGDAGMFEQHRFDLVVTDHKMPRMDGLSLIKKIHGISATTQVVLLSGFVDVLGLNEQTTGAAAVIQKSANEVPHLLRAVARLMKKKPVARERAAR